MPPLKSGLLEDVSESRELLHRLLHLFDRVQERLEPRFHQFAFVLLTRIGGAVERGDRPAIPDTHRHGYRVQSFFQFVLGDAIAVSTRLEDALAKLFLAASPSTS